MARPTGHVPLLGACKACGQRSPVAGVPCPNQDAARGLLQNGYMAMPGSPEHLERVILGPGRTAGRR